VTEADSRVQNNAFRHQYRVLNESEKAHITKLKDLGAEFLAELHRVNQTYSSWRDGSDPKLKTRELSLAQTKIEEAVMWAVKSITQ